MYKWHVFLLTLGRFRRTTGVSRSTGRSHFFWEAMWPNKKAGSVRFSLWKTAHVDKKDYEEVWDAISPLRSPPLSLFFFYDTFFPYSLALLTYFKLQRNSAKCLVISTFQSPFHYHFHDLFDRSSLFCSWFSGHERLKKFEVVFTFITLFHHLYIWCTDKMYQTTMGGGGFVLSQTTPSDTNSHGAN